MKIQLFSYLSSLIFWRKKKSKELIDREGDILLSIPIKVQEAESLHNEIDALDSNYDDYDYEEKYRPLFEHFSEIVNGTRYEKYAANTTCLWAFENLLNDNSKGKTTISAKYQTKGQEESYESTEEIYEDYRRFEIDAFHIDSFDLEVLRQVFESASIEVEDPEEFERPLFELKLIKNSEDVAFAECFHPHYSSYKTVSGNKYDDNIDTYGTSLGIMAVRCYLLYNTDTNEFVLADGRYWCM